jgi:ATP-dependent Clp protease ATP-binding subunit ClpA
MIEIWPCIVATHSPTALEFPAGTIRIRSMATPNAPVDDIFQSTGKLRMDAIQDSTAEALREAMNYARTTRWDSVRSPHLFMGLLAAPDDGIHSWGNRLGADLPKLLDQFAELFHQDEGESEPYLSLNREFLSDNVIRLLREAFQRASDQHRRVTPIDVLICLFTAPNSIVADCFERIGVTAARLTELAVIAEKQCSAR